MRNHHFISLILILTACNTAEKDFEELDGAIIDTDSNVVFDGKLPMDKSIIIPDIKLPKDRSHVKDIMSNPSKDIMIISDSTVDHTSSNDLTSDVLSSPCPYNSPCTDWDPCTYEDLCKSDGECRGIPYSCNDGQPCTDDECGGSGPNDCAYPVKSTWCLIDDVCYSDGAFKDGNSLDYCHQCDASHPNQWSMGTHCTEVVATVGTSGDYITSLDVEDGVVYAVVTSDRIVRIYNGIATDLIPGYTWSAIADLVVRQDKVYISTFHSIKVIDNGQVTEVPGSPLLWNPWGIDADDNASTIWFVADFTIQYIQNGSVQYAYAGGYPQDSFQYVCHFSDIKLYATRGGLNQVLKIANDTANVYAGSNVGNSGDNAGIVNLQSALLNMPTNIACTPDDWVYVIDFGNNKIKRLAGGTIQTIVASSGHLGGLYVTDDHTIYYGENETVKLYQDAKP